MDETHRSRSDVAHSAARAVISAVPILGGPLQILFEEVLPRPVEKRREKWLNALTEAVSNLEKDLAGFSYENLADNESFISAVLQASQIAQRTHSEKKIDALRNAVENSGRKRGDHTQQIFLHFVDEFTPWHLEALDCLHTPVEHILRKSRPIPEWEEGDLVMLIEYAFPELRDERNLPYVIISELQRRGLVHGKEPYETLSRADLLHSSSLTSLGLRFFRFITPAPDKPKRPSPLGEQREPFWTDPNQLVLFPEDRVTILLDMPFKRMRVFDWTILYNSDVTSDLYRHQIDSFAEQCRCDHCEDFAAARHLNYPAPFLRMLMGLGVDPTREVAIVHGVWPNDSGYFAGSFQFVGAIVDPQTDTIWPRGFSSVYIQETDNFKWRFCSPSESVSGFRKDISVEIEFMVIP